MDKNESKKLKSSAINSKVELVDSDECTSEDDKHPGKHKQHSTPKSANKQGYSLRKNQRVNYYQSIYGYVDDDDDDDDKDEANMQKKSPPEKGRSNESNVVLIDSSPEHISTHRSRIISDQSDDDDGDNNAKEVKKKNNVAHIKDDEDDDEDDDDVENLWGDDESEVEEERLWCICQKPSTGQFMIMCDECYDWYHGDCVGLTREVAKALKKNDDRYICPFCKNNPEYFDRYKSELAKKGRFYKPQQTTTEDDKKAHKKISTTKPEKSQSISASSSSKDHATSHKPSTALKKSSTAPPTQPSTTHNQSSNNKRQNCFNQKCKAPLPETRYKPHAIYCNESCLRAYVDEFIRNRSSSSSSNNQIKFFNFSLQQTRTLEGISNKTSSELKEHLLKFLLNRPSGHFLAPKTTTTSSTTTKTPLTDPKKAAIKPPKPEFTKVGKPKPNTDAVQLPKYTTNDHDFRQNVVKNFIEVLQTRVAESHETFPVSIPKICEEIEEAMYAAYSHSSNLKYRHKYINVRSSFSNTKNDFFKRVLSGAIDAKKLVTMSSLDMTSEEVAEQRAKETTAEFQAIEKAQRELAEAAKRNAIKVTHKGEVYVRDEDLSNLSTNLMPQTNAPPSTASASLNRSNSSNDEPIEVEPEVVTNTEDTFNNLVDNILKKKTPDEQPDVPKLPAKKHFEPDFGADSDNEDAAKKPKYDEFEVEFGAQRVTYGPSQPVYVPQIEIDEPVVSQQQNNDSKKVFWRGKFVNTEPNFGVSAHLLGFFDGGLNSIFDAKVDEASFRGSELEQSGRVLLESALVFLNDIRLTQSRELHFIGFEVSENASEENKVAFKRYLELMKSRQRYGKVELAYNGFKDLYLMPYEARDDLPEVLKEFEKMCGFSVPSDRDLIVGILMSFDKNSPGVESSVSGAVGVGVGEAPKRKSSVDINDEDIVRLAKVAKSAPSPIGTGTPTYERSESVNSSNSEVIVDSGNGNGKKEGKIKDPRLLMKEKRKVPVTVPVPVPSEHRIVIGGEENEKEVFDEFMAMIEKNGDENEVKRRANIAILRLKNPELKHRVSSELEKYLQARESVASKSPPNVFVDEAPMTSEKAAQSTEVSFKEQFMLALHNVANETDKVKKEKVQILIDLLNNMTHEMQLELMRDCPNMLAVLVDFNAHASKSDRDFRFETSAPKSIPLEPVDYHSAHHHASSASSSSSHNSSNHHQHQHQHRQHHHSSSHHHHHHHNQHRQTSRQVDDIVDISEASGSGGDDAHHRLEPKQIPLDKVSKFNN